MVIKISGTVTDATATLYYRIKASYNDRYSYSDIISYNPFDYLGELGSITINGERFDKDKVYIFNEGDTLTIKVKRSNSDSNLRISYTPDGKNYIKLGNYDSKHKIEVDSSYTTYTININYRECLLRLRLSSIYGSKESDDYYLDFYLLVDFLYSEDVLKYFSLINNSSINELNLFN